MGMVASPGAVLCVYFAGQKYVASLIIQEDCGELGVLHCFQEAPPPRLSLTLVIA